MLEPVGELSPCDGALVASELSSFVAMVILISVMQGTGQSSPRTDGSPGRGRDDTTCFLQRGSPAVNECIGDLVFEPAKVWAQGETSSIFGCFAPSWQPLDTGLFDPVSRRSDIVAARVAPAPFGSAMLADMTFVA
jgi:hypothetical protein